MQIIFIFIQFEESDGNRLNSANHYVDSLVQLILIITVPLLIGKYSIQVFN
jgi:hypothetical protein